MTSPKQKRNDLGLGIALLLCYSVATLFAGISFGTATLFALYPGHGTVVRPLVGAGICLSFVLAGWILMPKQRPQAAALVLRILMMWDLIIVAVVVRVHLHGGPIHPKELTAIGICVAIFAVGIYATRYTKWGHKAFVRQ